MTSKTVITIPTHGNPIFFPCWSSLIRYANVAHFIWQKVGDDISHEYFSTYWLNHLVSCVICEKDPSVRKFVIERPVKKCKAWWCHYMKVYHDVVEISDFSQSEAPNLVMWRVRVMQPTTPSPWRRGRSGPQFNVQGNGSMKCHWKYIAGQH